MKKRIIYFILLNILITILEYILIFIFLNKILSLKLVLSLIIILFLLTLNIVLSMLFTKNIFNDITIEDENKIKKYQDKLTPFIEYANSKLNTNVKIKYVDLDIKPNPAWCVDDMIYINIAYSSVNDELLGMCAHEIGHLYSGLSKHINFYYLRVTSILALLINLLIKLICMLTEQNKIFKIIGTVIYIPLYIIYLIINVFNHIAIYPFLRNDENIANDISIELGYGNELLYYYKMIYYHEDIYSIKLQRLIDFEHPKVEKMIQLMINKINNEDLNNGYLIYNNTLMLCDNNEQNLFLSSNIIKIEYDAFSFKKDVESITSNTLEKIESFKNLKNLIKLDTPNLNTFPTNILIICENLKQININNVEGRYLLGLSYLKINNKDVAIALFEKNDIHFLSLKELLKLYKDEEKIILTYQKLASLNDMYSIKYLISYYEKNEQYDQALEYINKTNNESFINYKKGTYYYYGYSVEQDVELAGKYLSLSNEKEAVMLLEKINEGGNCEQ